MSANAEWQKRRDSKNELGLEGRMSIKAEWQKRRDLKNELALNGKISGEAKYQNRRDVNKRPFFVWFISIYYCLSSIIAIYLFSSIYSTHNMHSTGYDMFLNGLSVSSVIMTLLVSVLNFTGAVVIFILKKHAYYIFVASLILSIISVCYSAIYENMLYMPRYNTLIGIGIAWVIMIRVVFYAKSLIKAGVLK